MGLLSGFKAKLIGKRSNKAPQIVCLNYKISTNFDGLPENLISTQNGVPSTSRKVAETFKPPPQPKPRQPPPVPTRVTTPNRNDHDPKGHENEVNDDQSTLIFMTESHDPSDQFSFVGKNAVEKNKPPQPEEAEVDTNFTFTFVKGTAQPQTERPDEERQAELRNPRPAPRVKFDSVTETIPRDTVLFGASHAVNFGEDESDDEYETGVAPPPNYDSHPLRESGSSSDYSRQAASIFFGSDEEPEIARPRRIQFDDDDDDDDASQSGSASV